MKYIFEVHIKGDQSAEDYARAWVRASEIIQRAPERGALNYTANSTTRMC